MIKPILQLTLALTLLLASSAPAQSTQPAPPKLAIICPDIPNLDDLLIADFSSSKNLALIDRQSIRSVLREQSLQSLSSDNTLKIGKLIAADFLLVLQPLKDKAAKSVTLRIQLIETKTGILLLDQLEEQDSLAKSPAALRQSLEPLLAKAALPTADRRLLGIISIRSEEPGRSLDPLAQTLDVLIREDLTRSPNVIVLDREQLQHLTAEHNLTGLELQLKSSTTLLDLTLKRSSPPTENQNLDLTLQLTTSSKSQTLKLTLPSKDLAAFRQKLTEEILKALKAPLPPDSAAPDLKSEAAAFAERARLLKTQGYPKEAIKLAEAAYALDPKPYYALQAYQFHMRIASPVGNEPPTVTERLLAARRAMEIEVNMLAQLAAANDLKQINGKIYYGSAVLPHLDIPGIFPLPATPQNPQQQIVFDLVELEKTKRRIILDFCHNEKISVERANCGYLTEACFLVHDRAEYLQEAHAAIEEWRCEVASGLCKKTEASSMFTNLAVPQPDQQLHTIGNFTQADFRPLLEWMTKQPELTLRVTGWNCLATFPGAEGANAAKKTLDILYRQQNDDDIPRALNRQLQNTPTSQAWYRMRNDGSLEPYFLGLLDEAEKNRDSMLLVRWACHTDQLLSVVIQPGWTIERKKTIDLCQRIENIINANPIPPTYAAHLKYLKERVASHIKDFTPPTIGSAWNNYQPTEIKIAKPPPNMELIWMELDRSKSPPDFLLVWRSNPKNLAKGVADFDLSVTRMPFAGGIMQPLGTATFSGPVGTGPSGFSLHGFRITSGVATPDGLFLADYGRGILVVRDSKITAWTDQDALPSKHFWALTYAHGKLYAGMAGGLAEIDPKTAACKMLAASKSLPSINPLDGGTLYRVGNILLSPDGKTLWLSIGGDATRSGVWTCDLATNTFKRIIPDSDKFNPDREGPPISLNGDKILVLGKAPGLFDPLSTKRESSLHYPKNFGQPFGLFPEPDPQSLSGVGGTITSISEPGAPIDPSEITSEIHYTHHRQAVLVGPHLFTTGSTLTLPDGSVQAPAKPFFGKNPAYWWNLAERFDNGFIAVTFNWQDMAGNDYPPTLWNIQPRQPTTTAPAK